MTVLIDLGEIGADMPARAAPRPVNRSRLLTCLGLVALLGLTMSASRRSPRLVEVATIRYDPSAAEASSYLLDGDRLYVRSAAMTAYRLSDGARLWQVPFGDSDVSSGVMRAGGHLITATGRCDGPPGPGLTALDQRTGRELWRLPGRPVGRFATGAIAVNGRPPGDGCDDDQQSGLADEPTNGPMVRLQAVDPGTGRVIWELPDTSWLTVQTGYDATGTITRIVIADVTGAVRGIDLATGRVTATARLPDVAEAYQRTDYHSPAVTMSVAGDLFVIMLPVAENSVEVTAYSVRDLRRLWDRRFPLEPGHGGPDSSIWYVPCGRLFCVHLPSTTYAVDPDTGAVRWRLSELRVVGSTDRWLLLADSMENRGVFRIIDSGTGRMSELTTGYTSGIVAFDRGRVVFSYNRFDTTAFTVFDLTSRRSRFLGRVPGTYQYCDYSDRYLACTDGRTFLRVWRVVE
jgi:outer membrane protein assembly factor BamB